MRLLRPLGLLLSLHFCLLGCLWAQKPEYHYVRWVVDGDTIVLDNGVKVRYASINAPEIAHEGEPGEPFGRVARRANKRLVRGKEILVEPAEQPHDRYGRLLAYVFLPGRDLVQKRLVSQGLAFVCYEPPNLKYYATLLQVQRKAMNRKRGLWGAREFLRGEPYYIGNRRSRRFHRPSCPFGRRTRGRNRVIFKTMERAFRQGYCPCHKCRPWPGRRNGKR